MMSRYWDLRDDIEFPNRWYLDEIQGVDNWSVRTKVPKSTAILECNIYQSGDPLDFTLNEGYGLPIVSARLAKVFAQYDGVTLTPVLVENTVEKFFLLTIERIVDCLDKTRSQFEIIPENDEVRPDLAGNYRSVTKLKVDPEALLGVDICRIRGFDIVIVASQRLMDSINAVGPVGVYSTDVS